MQNNSLEKESDRYYKELYDLINKAKARLDDTTFSDNIINNEVTKEGIKLSFQYLRALIENTKNIQLGNQENITAKGRRVRRLLEPSISVGGNHRYMPQSRELIKRVGDEKLPDNPSKTDVSIEIGILLKTIYKRNGARFKFTMDFVPENAREILEEEFGGDAGKVESAIRYLRRVPSAYKAYRDKLIEETKNTKYKAKKNERTVHAQVGKEARRPETADATWKKVVRDEDLLSQLRKRVRIKRGVREPLFEQRVGHTTYRIYERFVYSTDSEDGKIRNQLSELEMKKTTDRRDGGQEIDSINAFFDMPKGTLTDTPKRRLEKILKSGNFLKLFNDDFEEIRKIFEAKGFIDEKDIDRILNERKEDRTRIGKPMDLSDVRSVLVRDQLIKRVESSHKRKPDPNMLVEGMAMDSPRAGKLLIVRVGTKRVEIGETCDEEAISYVEAGTERNAGVLLTNLEESDLIDPLKRPNRPQFDGVTTTERRIDGFIEKVGGVIAYPKSGLTYVRIKADNSSKVGNFREDREDAKRVYDDLLGISKGWKRDGR